MHSRVGERRTAHATGQAAKCLGRPTRPLTEGLSRRFTSKLRSKDGASRSACNDGRSCEDDRSGDGCGRGGSIMSCGLELLHVATGVKMVTRRMRELHDVLLSPWHRAGPAVAAH